MPRSAKTRISLFPDDGHLTVFLQFDDTGRLVGFVLLTTRPAYIVDRLKDFRGDIAIVLGSRFTTDIGGGRLPLL